MIEHANKIIICITVIRKQKDVTMILKQVCTNNYDGDKIIKLDTGMGMPIIIDNDVNIDTEKINNILKEFGY